MAHGGQISCPWDLSSENLTLEPLSQCMCVKNVEPQTYGIGFCLLVRSPGHSYAHCSLRNIALEPIH